MAIFDHIGDLYGLFSGIFLAAAYLLIKVLTVTDALNRIVFYFFVFGALLQIPLLTIAGPMPSGHDCIIANLAGISFLLAQLSLVKAYNYANASQVGVYQYSSVIFVGLIDWAFWGYLPPLIDLLGVILVIAAGSIIIRDKPPSPRRG